MRAGSIAQTAAVAAIVIIAALISGCSALKGSASPTQHDSVAAGRQLFVANCVSCHGEKGDRVPVAPLNVKEFLDMRGDATLVQVISDGKGVMPAWGSDRGGPLTLDQIANVVAYLNATAGRSSPTILAGSGQTVFQQNCVRCHGDKGDRIPAVPLTEKSFLDSRTDARLMDVISNGKNQMPAFRGGNNPLTEDQVRAVVSYLRYNADTATAEQARQGHNLYLSNCLACHGERGDRVPNVALTSPDLLRRLGDGKLTSVIADGSGVMPGFSPAKGGTFQAAQIGALLAYLKSTAGLPADAALVGSETASTGRDLFINNCAGCHGDGGDKVAGANLRSPAFLNARSDVELQRQISQGNTRGMPAWGKANGGPLSADDIESVIDYLRSNVRNVSTDGTAAAQSAPPTPKPTSSPAVPQTASTPAGEAVVARGKDIFTKNCAACHGDTRDKMLDAKLADFQWLQQRGDDALSQSIANGKGIMPSWGKQKGGPLSSDDIAAVLAYLKAAAQGGPGGSPTAALPTPTEIVLTGNAARGQNVFAKNCQACHGVTRDKIATARLADPAWLQRQGDDALSDSIVNGKGGMPAMGVDKGGPITPYDIVLLLAYLKAAAGNN